MKDRQDEPKPLDWELPEDIKNWKLPDDLKNWTVDLGDWTLPGWYDEPKPNTQTNKQ